MNRATTLKNGMRISMETLTGVHSLRKSKRNDNARRVRKYKESMTKIVPQNLIMRFLFNSPPPFAIPQ